MNKIQPLLLAALLLAGCATKRACERDAANHPRVRATAYLGKRNALGQPLRHGGGATRITSAASDWSQFPVGTRFRIPSAGNRLYEIDDYGSALVGTRTVDLCVRNHREMRRWGARWVEIEILEWGSPRRSLEIAAPRTHAWYVRKMVDSLREQSEGLPEKMVRRGRTLPVRHRNR